MNLSSLAIPLIASIGIIQADEESSLSLVESCDFEGWLYGVYILEAELEVEDFSASYLSDIKSSGVIERIIEFNDEFIESLSISPNSSQPLPKRSDLISACQKLSDDEFIALSNHFLSLQASAKRVVKEDQ